MNATTMVDVVTGLTASAWSAMTIRRLPPLPRGLPCSHPEGRIILVNCEIAHVPRFHRAWLVRRGNLGWATHEAWFPYTSILAHKETDNHVWLETDHVTFQLQADGVVSCSAVGLIHDLVVGTRLAPGETRFDFAAFNSDGVVVGTHRAVQPDDGPELDADDVLERVRERAAVRSDRTVDVVPVDLSGVPEAADFRIDVRTRRPIPPRGDE